MTSFTRLATPALILIDVQAGFRDPYWGVRGQPQAETRMEELLLAFRAASAPVVHVQHCSVESQSPLRPGQPGNDFMAFAHPQGSEPVFQKSVNSAFIGTRLESWLRAQGIERLLIAGLTTDHCVSTTTRMAGNLGFETVVAQDATATFHRVGFDGRQYPAEQVHEIALASLHGEFATVLDSAQALARFFPAGLARR